MALTILSQAAGESLCSCTREIASIKEELASIVGIRDELAELQRRLARVEGVGGEKTTTSAAVDAAGDTVRRSLAHGGAAHHVAVRAYQVHEFPSGTCYQAGARMYALPKARASPNTLSYKVISGTLSIFDAMILISIIVAIAFCVNIFAIDPNRQVPCRLG